MTEFGEALQDDQQGAGIKKALIISFVRNQSLIRDTVEIVERAVVVPPGSVDVQDLERHLRQLEPLLIRLTDLDRMDELGPPFGQGFRLYRGTAVNHRARGVYIERLGVPSCARVETPWSTTCGAIIRPCRTSTSRLRTTR